MRVFRMEFTFVVESMIRGYHEYKTVWENPVLAEELRCTRTRSILRTVAARFLQIRTILIFQSPDRRFF